MKSELHEKQLAAQIKRRFDELQITPQKFLNRFDKNGDGELDSSEIQAAMATLRHEILAEKEQLVTASCKRFKLEEILEDRFRILSAIGSGAQSNVYLARDISNDAVVVLKQMRITALNTWQSYDAFQREARVLAEIDHPNVPTIIDSFTSEDAGETTFILVQSYLAGDNLEEILKSGRLFTEPELISIARQCLEILSFLHQHSPTILHRDVKPSNLLLDDSGTLSLIDFGVVQYARDSKTLAMGTTGYMAPEQLVGRAIPQSDMFSLGVTLIRLATGKKPEELGLKSSRLQWRKLASLSKGFSNWIDRMIDPESEDRFESAAVAEASLDKMHEVVVIRESKRTQLLTTSLEEIENNLTDPNFRIWSSPELFVCTVGKQATTGFLTRLHISMLNVLEGGSHRKGFHLYGSGFSFTTDSVIEIRCGGWSVGKSKVEALNNGKYPDGEYAIFGEYQEPITDVLTKSEIVQVWKALSKFCKSNGMDIL